MVIKHRSPNYPGIDLEESVQVLATLYQGVGRGQFTANDAAKAWGYKSTGGPAKVRLASLRQYGLVEGRKGENPHLSNRALTLVLRNQASKEYRQALREAALAPTLFAELHSAMHDAAPDALRQHLIVERSFTDEGASRFIEVFRSSTALANPTEYDKMGTQDEDNSHEDDEEKEMPPPPSPGTITIPVPFGPDKIGTVTLPVQMTPEDWGRLDMILKAYMPVNSRPEDKKEPTDANSEPDSTATDGYP